MMMSIRIYYDRILSPVAIELLAGANVMNVEAGCLSGFLLGFLSGESLGGPRNTQASHSIS